MVKTRYRASAAAVCAVGALLFTLPAVAGRSVFWGR